MNKLEEKKDKFLEELNNRLPDNIKAQYRQSQKMPNVLNVLIVYGVQVVAAFGLIQDKDSSGNDEVYWFENTTGRIY